MTDTIYFIVIGVVGLITALLILTAVSDEKEVRAMTVAFKGKRRKTLLKASIAEWNKAGPVTKAISKKSISTKKKPKKPNKSKKTTNNLSISAMEAAAITLEEYNSRKRHKRTKVESKL